MAVITIDTEVLGKLLRKERREIDAWLSGDEHDGYQAYLSIDPDPDGDWIRSDEIMSAVLASKV